MHHCWGSRAELPYHKVDIDGCIGSETEVVEGPSQTRIPYDRPCQ